MFARCSDCKWEGDFWSTKTIYIIREHTIIGKCPNCGYLVDKGNEARLEKFINFLETLASYFYQISGKFSKLSFKK